MAGTKISSFSSLDSGSLSANDTFLVVDVSDQLYSPNGTNKKTDLSSILQSPLNPIRKNLIDLDDTPSGYGQIGQVLKVGPDGNSLVFSNAAAGTGSGALSEVFSFSDLNDTPDSLSSGDGKFLFVSGNSIQYKDLESSSFAVNFTDLQDTPETFSGQEGKCLLVSGGEINYGDISTNFTGLLDTPSVYGNEGDFISFSGNSLVYKNIPTGDFLKREDLSGINLNSFSGVEISGLEGYLTSGEIDSTYLRKSETGQFLHKSLTGDFVTDEETGSLVSLDYLYDYLRVDISGNASEVSGTYKGSILGKDTFYGDGVSQDFPLSFSPQNSHSILVALNGLIQSSQSNYYLSNNNSGLSFHESIPSGMEIDVRHIGGFQGSSIKGADNFLGNGIQRKFNLSYSSENAYSMMVAINGVFQSSENNYYLSDNNSSINFYEPVPSGLEIDIRHVAGPVLVGATTNIVSTPSFISLLDTPQSYHQDKKVLIASPSGIEFSGVDFKSSFKDLLDTPEYINTTGQVLVTSGDYIAFSGLDVRTSFVNLEDTPSGMGGEGKALVASGDKLIFSGLESLAYTGSNFLDLLDTPSGYSDDQAVLVVNSGGIEYSQSYVKKEETGSFLYGISPTSENEGQFISVSPEGDLVYSHIIPVNDNSIAYDYSRIFPEVLNSGAMEITGLNDTPNYLPQNNQVLSYFNQKWEYKTFEDSSVSKAWVSFKYIPSGITLSGAAPSGTPASGQNTFDYESFNISGINRIDKGKYSISFDNTFGSQDYCFNGNGYSTDEGWPVVPSKSINQQNSGSVFYLSVKSGQELIDPTEDYIHLSFFAN